MELLPLTKFEIFFNPNDLNLILTQERDRDGDGNNITYGFTITRGRWGSFKKLVEVRPHLPSLDAALNALFKYLESVLEIIQIPEARPGTVLTRHIFGTTQHTLRTKRIVSTWMATTEAA